MQAASRHSTPRQPAPPAEPELILPPLKAVAVLVTGITTFLLAAILAAHWIAGPGSSYPADQAGQGRKLAPAAPQERRDAGYPYTDPATIGLY